jgi:hypothetical protein
MSEPDFFSEAIIAWRAWVVNKKRDSVRLRSTSMSTVWEPNAWLEASCKKQHNPPAKRCGCGIYAVNNFNYLQGLKIVGPSGVFGEVWLAGEIVEGTAGYRAARAYPKHIYVPHTKWHWVDALRDTYDVPVTLRNPYEGKDWRKR